MSKWLVTGAAGFLGSHIVEQLLAQQIPVVAVDNLSAGRLHSLAMSSNHPLFKFVCEDIRNVSTMIKLIEEDAPDVVVHLAALHFIPAAVRNPSLALSLNVDGTRAMLQACHDAPVTHFWFASTADVYRASDQPHHESSEIGPFNIYGATKWMGEELLRQEAETLPGRRFVVGRLFNLYGTRDPTPHILPEIISQLRNSGSSVLRLGNVTPCRDLVPVADAARAVIESMQKAPVGVTVVNIATGVSISIIELVEKVSAVIGRKLAIEVAPDKVRTVERPFMQADIRKLRSMIGWAPHSDIMRGIHELLKFEGIPCLNCTSASSPPTSGWAALPIPTI
jgi:UDP-glucose 4-epimerase